MTTRKVAEVFHPGEFLAEELEARGISQIDLAEILGRDAQLINGIIAGKRSITPETAIGLGKAFGTGAQYWMNLETSFQLSKAKEKDRNESLLMQLYESFPVREMIRRHWIESSNNVDVLISRFREFLGIDAFSNELYLNGAFRKSAPDSELSSTEKAWFCRVKQLAKTIFLKERFSEKKLDTCLEQLHLLLTEPEEVRKVPGILADAGIRFLIVEHLPKTRIDGVCFWLDKDSPVIALSMRFDRNDWFWHTLIHELIHVKRRDGLEKEIIEIDLVGENKIALDARSENERAVDSEAANFLIPKNKIESFIARIRPHYYKAKIMSFSQLNNVHPGITVGQLQHRKEIPYSHNREMLAKVRNFITSYAFTDGWGHTPIVKS